MDTPGGGGGGGDLESDSDGRLMVEQAWGVGECRRASRGGMDMTVMIEVQNDALTYDV
jgi:hypothetical protein